ncbi:hypothetical protein DM860_009958 [Cuscuta australis]|uniref:Aluminum-activated malate transporter n=1 Tax=Cuscuta australis TaxID=267555 RepID=A0A328DCJ7_9ASTE|nr:hypothetical protein DM860_009958 [Cuscuta australis]
MQMESVMHGGEKAAAATSIFRRWRQKLKAFPKELFGKAVEVAEQTRALAKDDPRRVIHSFKVGLSLTLVSLLYYLHPFYKSFGVSTMWAVVTVVVVFEFSVGATLGKGVNRGLATLVACGLGIGAHYLANQSGKICEPLLLGLFVFLQAVTSTFVRFFPTVKARYDYGLVIFILTFCLISISGFRKEEIVDLAHKRFSAIAIGASICVIVSICVFPVWAGEDLHNLVADNLELLGFFLKGFGAEYFKDEEDGNSEAKSPSFPAAAAGYTTVLNSKTIEETLANFARWEPGHGRFKFQHPWKQYLKIGTLTRQCASRVESLNGYLSSQLQMPKEMIRTIRGACTKMSMESGEALQELASCMRNMSHPTAAATKHLTNSKTAAKSLKLLLINYSPCSFSEDGGGGGVDLLQVIPAAAVATILAEIVACVETIGEAVTELALLAQFKVVDGGSGSGEVVISLEEKTSKVSDSIDVIIASEPSDSRTGQTP